MKAHHRIAERHELARLLEAGRSIQMPAPRRIGKTWLIGKLAEDLKAKGWICVSIDLQGMRTEQQFFRTLCQEIEKSQDLHRSALAHLLARFRHHIKDGAGAASLLQLLTQGVDPRAFSESLIKSLDGHGKKTVVLIDEISLFVQELAKSDAGAARAFLYHLRNLREANRNVRWLFTGSIGLDVVAARFGLQDALVDMDIFELRPFNLEEARESSGNWANKGGCKRRSNLAGDRSRSSRSNSGGLRLITSTCSPERSVRPVPTRDRVSRRPPSPTSKPRSKSCCSLCIAAISRRGPNISRRTFQRTRPRNSRPSSACCAKTPTASSSTQFSRASASHSRM
jgi:hypothetical protein